MIRVLLHTPLADISILLQLLRPEFSTFTPRERQHEIFDLITRLIDKLGSPEVAIDERHTPALHSRFLHSLLRKHRRDLAVSSRQSDQHQPPSQPQAQTSSRGPGASTSTSANTNAGAFQQAQASQYTTLGGSGAAGASYESIAGSSPASFSDSSFTVGGPASPVFETEPSYTTVNGGMNGHGHGHTHDPMFQFGAQQDESWGALLALQNPNYWKDMMMPGCVFTLS